MAPKNESKQSEAKKRMMTFLNAVGNLKLHSSLFLSLFISEQIKPSIAVHQSVLIMHHCANLLKI